MRRFAVLFVLLLLSGCSGGSKGPATSPTLTGTHTPTATLGVTTDLPNWVPGQSWTYAVEIPGIPTTRFKMMVAEDQDELWIVATDNRTKALHHALYSTNPVLGRITKVALSPFQSGEPVEMFRFPLSDQAVWTSAFFGESMDFEAVYDDAVATLPDVFLPGYQITAKGDSGARVLYNYVEAVQWFSDFQYFDAAGTKQIHLSLQQFGETYRGDFHFLRGGDNFLRSFTASTDVSNPPTFNVTEDDGLDAIGVGLIAQGQGDQQALVNVTLKDPEGTVRLSRQYLLPKDQLETGMQETATANGEWAVEVIILGTATVEVRVAGLRVVSGTL